MQVWRIAFFGRLEERKGIKLFVEAISKLQKTSKVMNADRFEIFIVGPEAVIDMVRSSPSQSTQCIELLHLS